MILNDRCPDCRTRREDGCAARQCIGLLPEEEAARKIKACRIDIMGQIAPFVKERAHLRNLFTTVIMEDRGETVFEHKLSPEAEAVDRALIESIEQVIKWTVESHKLNVIDVGILPLTNARCVSGY